MTLRRRKTNSLFKKLVTVVLILAIGSFAILESIIVVNGFPQDNVRTDYVIILGAGLYGETVSPILKERLDKGVEYLRKYPDTTVIVTGGKGSGESITEGEAMERYLLSKGINESRIIKEEQSTSTMENFKFSRQVLLIAEGRSVKNIMVITSNFHMLRSKMLARRNGFEPYGISCRTPYLFVIIHSYVREYFALVKSFFFDR